MSPSLSVCSVRSLHLHQVFPVSKMSSSVLLTDEEVVQGSKNSTATGWIITICFILLTDIHGWQIMKCLDGPAVWTCKTWLHSPCSLFYVSQLASSLLLTMIEELTITKCDGAFQFVSLLESLNSSAPSWSFNLELLLKSDLESQTNPTSPDIRIQDGCYLCQ